MFALILLIVFGMGMAYFATQNTGMVHIFLAGYLISGIPLYIVVIGALLLGVFVSWLISIVDNITSQITIHGKDTALTKAEKTIENLKEEIKTLGSEKSKNLNDNSNGEVEEKASPRSSFLEHLRHNFG